MKKKKKNQNFISFRPIFDFELNGKRSHAKPFHTLLVFVSASGSKDLLQKPDAERVYAKLLVIYLF